MTPGAQPEVAATQGTLAQWREEAQITLAGLLDKLSIPMPEVGSRESHARSLACKLKAHLAAMPAQPNLDCDGPGCLLQGIAHSHEKGEPFCAECAQALTGQPDVNTELLTKMNGLVSRFGETSTAPWCCHGQWPYKPCECGLPHHPGCIVEELRPLIAQAEEAAKLHPVCECGGRPGEHRERLGDGAWCVCTEDCPCQGYVAKGAAK